MEVRQLGIYEGEIAGHIRRRQWSLFVISLRRRMKGETYYSRM